MSVFTRGLLFRVLPMEIDVGMRFQARGLILLLRGSFALLRHECCCKGKVRKAVEAEKRKELARRAACWEMRCTVWLEKSQEYMDKRTKYCDGRCDGRLGCKRCKFFFIFIVSVRIDISRVVIVADVLWQKVVVEGRYIDEVADQMEMMTDSWSAHGRTRVYLNLQILYG